MCYPSVNQKVGDLGFGFISEWLSVLSTAEETAYLESVAPEL